MNGIVLHLFRKYNRFQKNTNTVDYSVYSYSGIVPYESALIFDRIRLIESTLTVAANSYHSNVNSTL